MMAQLRETLNEDNFRTFNSITALHKTKLQNISPQFFRDNRYTVNPNFGRTPNVLPHIGTYIMTQSMRYDGSQEFRVTSPQEARLRGTIGGNWFYTRTPGNSTGGFQTGATGIIAQQTREVTSTPAVFGGIYYDIAENLTVSAEARYQWDKITSQQKTPALGRLFSETFKSFSPRLTIDYKYAEDSLAYVLWSRGYRPGGFNATLINADPVVLTQLAVLGAFPNYLQEKMDNFEIGLKSTWLDNRVRTRIAAYHAPWRNGQVSQSLNINTQAGGVLVAMVTTNVGAVDLHGIEAEAEAQITDQLNIRANFNWQASKVKDYVSAITIRINGSDKVNGKSFPKAPQMVWTVSPTYTDTLSGDWDWYVRGDWKYRGKYYADVSNVAWISPSNIFDLHLGIKNESLTLEVYGMNLTDDMHFQTAQQGNHTLCCLGASTVNGLQLYLPDKRQFGAKASYKF